MYPDPIRMLARLLPGARGAEPEGRCGWGSPRGLGGEGTPGGPCPECKPHASLTLTLLNGDLLLITPRHLHPPASLALSGPPSRWPDAPGPWGGGLCGARRLPGHLTGWGSPAVATPLSRGGTRAGPLGPTPAQPWCLSHHEARPSSPKLVLAQPHTQALPFLLSSWNLAHKLFT